MLRAAQLLLRLLEIVFVISTSNADRTNQQSVDVYALDTPYQQACNDWFDCPLYALAWNPGGEILAVGGDFGTRFYSQTLNLLYELDTTQVSHLAWNPEGNLLAITSGENILLWDINERTENHLLDSARYPTAWHPDGNLLAFPSSDGTQIYVYDVVLKKRIYTYNLNHNASEDIVFDILFWDKSGTSLVFVAAFNLYIWTPSTNEIEMVMPLPFRSDWDQRWDSPWGLDRDQIIVIPFNLNGTVNTIGRWDFGDESVLIKRFHFDSVSAGISWSPNGQYIAVAGRQTLSILDATTLDTLQVFPLTSWSQYSSVAIADCPDNVEGNMGHRVTWNPDNNQVLVGSTCRLSLIDWP